jgi:hypothetical protein
MWTQLLSTRERGYYKRECCPAEPSILPLGKRIGSVVKGCVATTLQEWKVPKVTNISSLILNSLSGWYLQTTIAKLNFCNIFSKGIPNVALRRNPTGIQRYLDSRNASNVFWTLKVDTASWSASYVGWSYGVGSATRICRRLITAINNYRHGLGWHIPISNSSPSQHFVLPLVWPFDLTKRSEKP